MQDEILQGLSAFSSGLLKGRMLRLQEDRDNELASLNRWTTIAQELSKSPRPEVANAGMSLAMGLADPKSSKKLMDMTSVLGQGGEFSSPDPQMNQIFGTLNPYLKSGSAKPAMSLTPEEQRAQDLETKRQEGQLNLEQDVERQQRIGDVQVQQRLNTHKHLLELEQQNTLEAWNTSNQLKTQQVAQAKESGTLDILANQFRVKPEVVGGLIQTFGEQVAIQMLPGLKQETENIAKMAVNRHIQIVPTKGLNGQIYDSYDLSNLNELLQNVPSGMSPVEWHGMVTQMRMDLKQQSVGNAKDSATIANLSANIEESLMRAQMLREQSKVVGRQITDKDKDVRALGAQNALNFALRVVETRIQAAVAAGRATQSMTDAMQAYQENATPAELLLSDPIRLQVSQVLKEQGYDPSVIFATAVEQISGAYNPSVTINPAGQAVVDDILGSEVEF